MDEPLIWFESSGYSNKRFLHADHQGGIIAVTGSTGNLLNRNAYDAYGNKQSSNSSYSSRFAYTGQIYLKEIGLHYYKARMYSSKLGRFMQTDPIGYADGINWYAYVGNDPINYIDPTGLAATYPTGSDGDPCEGVEEPCEFAGEMVIRPAQEEKEHSWWVRNVLMPFMERSNYDLSRNEPDWFNEQELEVVRLLGMGAGMVPARIPLELPAPTPVNLTNGQVRAICLTCSLWTGSSADDLTLEVTEGVLRDLRRIESIPVRIDRTRSIPRLENVE